ncbi:MAG: O-antigen ligase family protein [Candidatus Rokubacteria bacterium]|nr:O-antigen ligase family protein [Candidatus Rokubacteria bacterium]
MRSWLLLALTVGLAASISLAEITLVLLAAWLVFGPRPAAVPRAGWPLLGPLAAFAAWTLVAALASSRPVASLLAAKGLLTLGAFYVVLHALPDRAAARRFATGLFLAVSIVALLAVVQVGFCPPGGTVESGPLRLFFRKCARARGFFSIYMTLAGVLTLVLVSVLPRLARAGRSALWALPAWLAGVLALGLTQARGAWLGFAVGAVAGALTLRRRWLVLVALALVIAGTLAVEPGVLERLRTVGDLADDTARDRLAMLDAGLRLVRAHPVTGIGPGEVKRLYPAWATEEALRRSTSHLHDTPLQIVVERGIPGLAAWLAIWVAFFARAGRTLSRIPAGDEESRGLVLGSMAAIAAFLVAGLFEYNFGDTEVLLVALALMALPFAVARDLDAAEADGGRSAGGT